MISDPSLSKTEICGIPSEPFRQELGKKRRCDGTYQLLNDKTLYAKKTDPLCHSAPKLEKLCMYYVEWLRDYLKEYIASHFLKHLRPFYSKKIFEKIIFKPVFEAINATTSPDCTFFQISVQTLRVFATPMIQKLKA